MMKIDSHKGQQPQADQSARKTYQKPRILSVEMLEVVAATCDFSKAVVEFGSPCGVGGIPLNS